MLVDSPPILPVTDAAVLSKKVDGTMLVARAGVTSTKQFAQALEMLRRVEGPFIGAILNGVTGEGAYGYSYTYQYGATPTKAATSRAGSRNGSNGSTREKGEANGHSGPKVLDPKDGTPTSTTRTP